ncbi:sensor histidine kinase [Maribellus mangrovi]|uniref:sensor histidine kinase n=1 Tax=Maribellus mangrovi TaxID=3133146 RepID=UPI0030EB6A57
MKIFKYRVLNHVLFWIVIFAFFTFPRIVAVGFTLEAFVNLLYIPFDIIATYIFIEFLIPRFILKNRHFLLFSIGAIVTFTLNILVSQYIMYNIQPQLGFWTYKSNSVLSDVMKLIVNNLMIIGTASALKLFSYFYKIQLAHSELQRKTVQSELGILRSQVNPHFLFNVLNNIDALIFEDKEKASTAIFLLSKIMRYMLQESNHEKVTLDKEVEYIKDYLELAKLSFNSPNFLRFNLKGSTNFKEVPPLLFIPLIENAVKHCNKQVDPPGIEIDFYVNDEYIELHTKNFIKRNDFKLPDSGSGTGLKNVEKRLQLVHGDNYSFDINRNMDKFEVYLKVPLKTS